MTIQDTDLFLVNRTNNNYKIEAQNIMAVQDTDLFVVSRDSINYKVQASELKSYIGLPDNQFYIEIWGDGFLPSTFQSIQNGTVTGSIAVVNGRGGYTKLSMEIPSTYTLQIRPEYYLGGSNVQTNTLNGSTTTTTQVNVGGAAAGFGINGTWLAVVGGGGRGGYRSDVVFSTISYDGNVPYSNVTYSSPLPGTDGLGGYNITSPSAEPEVGGTSYSSSSGTLIQPDPSQPGSFGSFSNINSGAGGAGSLPGTGGSSGAGGTGGGANIRIWAEQQILDGYLTSFPDIRMKYLDSANGIHSSNAKIRITSKKTDLFVDYTTNQDVSVNDLITLLS